MMMKFDFSPVQMAMRAATAFQRPAVVPCVHGPSPEPEYVYPVARTGSANRARRRVAIARALSADCGSCRGIGCVDCDGTGLD